MGSREERIARIKRRYARLRERYIQKRLKRSERFKNHYENLKIFVVNRHEKRLERIRRRWDAMVKIREQQKNSTLGKLVKCLSPHRKLIILSLLMGILGALARLGAPMLIQQVSAIIVGATSAGGEWDFARINLYSGIAFALFFGGFVFDYFQAFIITGVTTRTSYELRKKIAAKINTLPFSYFDSRNIGGILNYATNDVDTVSNSTNLTLSSLMTSLIIICGTVIILFIYHWLLGLIALLCIPVGWILMYLRGRQSRKAFIEQKALIGEVASVAEESFDGLEIVKIFNATDLFKSGFADINYDLEKSTAKAHSIGGLLGPFMSLFGNILFILICFVCSYAAGKAGANPTYMSVLVAALTYAKQLVSPLTNIAMLIADFQQAIASASRIFTFLNEIDEPNEDAKTEHLSSVKGNVQFEHVSFGYNKNIIIHDFTKEIKAGHKIAIVGPTGAGKTTMVNLLMRFYEINGGKIKIEGVDTTTLNRSYVRSLFGMVLQDTWLFEGTFMENLKFSRRNASDEEVYAACKATHCDEFIQQAGGYNKVLNEECGLSSGQKQLLTIARAMVQNAPMLILDEATSSVDTRTELLIQDAMDQLMKGRTSFVIAHRLSTIKNADVIIVMDNGNIVETGKHKNLLRKHGLYAEIYNAQFSQN